MVDRQTAFIHIADTPRILSMSHSLGLHSVEQCLEDTKQMQVCSWNMSSRIKTTRRNFFCLESGEDLYRTESYVSYETVSVLKQKCSFETDLPYS